MKEIDSSACAQLCEGLGRPQRNLSVVHVAGSKGKGTVASLVGAGLSGAGHRVCVMTSPHVDCVTERVRVGKDLAPVSRETLADSLERSLDEASREASWFDVFVAASLDVAARSRCDYAVVECGLGGRLDSTNFLGAKIAALTSVEFEHTEVLGDTLAKIAREKAAIATRGGYLVCGNCVPLSARRSARAVARRRGAAFLRAPKGRSTVFGASNMGLAQAILKLLRIKQRRSFLEEGARKALPARRERLSPDVLVDGAHTPESVGELSKYLRGHNIVALVALGTDKNVERFAVSR